MFLSYGLKKCLLTSNLQKSKIKKFLLQAYQKIWQIQIIFLTFLVILLVDSNKYKEFENVTRGHELFTCVNKCL